MGQLSCREFVEFLADYLSGELPAEQIAVFDAHMAQCPSCVIYAKTYQESIRLGKAALLCSEEPVPAEVPDALIQAILAARKKSS